MITWFMRGGLGETANVCYNEDMAAKYINGHWKDGEREKPITFDQPVTFGKPRGTEKQEKGFASRDFSKRFIANAKTETVRISDLRPTQQGVSSEKMRAFAGQKYHDTPDSVSTVEQPTFHTASPEEEADTRAPFQGGPVRHSVRPQVVRRGGELYLQNGHHRVQAAHDGGDTTIKVNLYDEDKHPRDEKGRFI